MSFKSRIADEYQQSRAAKRERQSARYEAQEQRKTDSHKANLDLRNKAFDYAMQDDETRRFVIDTARDSYATGKKILKIGGIALLSGISIFVIYKLGSSIMDKFSNSRRVSEFTKDMDTSKLSYEKKDYGTWADKLYRIGFDQDSFSWTWTNYDEGVIRDVLKKMKNIDDWKYLVATFGSKEAKKGNGKGEYHDLPWFLAQDDDAPEWQEIINKLDPSVQL